ncbi:PAS domain S-box protein [Flavobacterium qiangtangense]|uniref:histidine kinase n=1 Tax=Flavobacterium qiangtangense TaxID=1442595 RepID=A0ABW1PS77_9FLAO
MHTEDFQIRLGEKLQRKAIAKLSYWNIDGKCLSINESCRTWYGDLLQHEMLPEEVVPHQSIATEYLRQALQDATVTLSLQVAYNQKHYRLTYIPDVEGNSVVGCVVQLDDITEFKIREFEQTATEQKFRTIIENAPDALIIANATGKIEMLNSRSEVLFGYNSDELIGQPVEMLMPERFRQGHPTKRQGFVENKHSRAMGNLILAGLRKDGSEFPTDVSLSPLHTPEGMLITAAFRDITQQVSRENEIKNYHEALQKQSSQIENILGSISESFCLIDSSWSIRYWNTAAEKTTGKSREMVMGKFMWDVFPQRKGSTLYDGCHEVMETRVASSFEHFSSEGTWFYNSAYPNADGGLTIYFKDITDRKNAENEVLAIKNNQYALINATKDLMWSVDVNYKLISANKGYDTFIENILGYKQILGECVLVDQLTGKYYEEWKDFFDRSLNGESFFMEIEAMPDYLTQFNPIFDQVSGQITGVACHSSNTSERNRLEKEKRDSAERFRAVVQNGSDLIFILDAYFSLSYISPSAVTLLGHENGLLGSSLLDVVHPESVDEVLIGIRKTATQRTVKLNELKIKDGNGNWLWLEATIDNLLDNTAVGGLVINARDITDYKRREAEREHLINELTRSNSDLMQFSFITSHNLRAPLSNIKGLLDFVDRSLLNEELSSVFDMISVSTQKLTETISDLSQLLIIRNTTEIPTSLLDIEKVFHRVNRNFLEAENDIEAQISINLPEPTVNFNVRYLESIFINLISNAIKYRSADRTLKIMIESKLVENGICLSFSDNGKGIDVARHGSRLFGMYQRFHPNTEGQGLGLFIIKAQIKALGGSVEVESIVDEGTSFHIFFPS